MDQEPVEQMDQDSTSTEEAINANISQEETHKDLSDETGAAMIQDPNNDGEPDANGVEQTNGQSSSENEGEGKSSEADQITEGTTVSGYLGYDAEGNVVLTEGDFVVGIEEVVGQGAEDEASSELVLSGVGGDVQDGEHQEMEDDGRVLAYIATDDLDKLVGLAETEIDSDMLNDDHLAAGSARVNGYDNHSDGMDDEDEEEEYEDGGDQAEDEVGESLETAEAEEPLAAEEVAEVSDEKNLGLKFPLTRVKRIMKADPDMQLVSQDAVFLITKATELFVEVVADAAYHHTLQAGRKTLLGRDLDACVDLIDALAFLDGALEADQ